jgi:hypothetical protein
LQKLSDPDFFTQWAAFRSRLFFTPVDKPAYREIKRRYDALSVEYRRRTGGLAATSLDY